MTSNKLVIKLINFCHKVLLSFFIICKPDHLVTSHDWNWSMHTLKIMCYIFFNATYFHFDSKLTILFRLGALYWKLKIANSSWLWRSLTLQFINLLTFFHTRSLSLEQKLDGGTWITLLMNRAILIYFFIGELVVVDEVLLNGKCVPTSSFFQQTDGRIDHNFKYAIIHECSCIIGIVQIQMKWYIKNTIFYLQFISYQIFFPRSENFYFNHSSYYM